MGNVSSKMLTEAKTASAIESKIRDHNPFVDNKKEFISTIYKIGSSLLTGKDNMEDGKLNKFLEVCLKGENFAAGVLVALCANRVNKVQDWIPRLDFRHFSSVMEFMLDHDYWRTVHEACSIRIVSNSELHNKTSIVLKAAKRSESHESVQKTFQLLLPMCQKIIALQNSAYSVIRGGDYTCFKFVIKETRTRLSLKKVTVQKRSSNWNTLFEAAVGFLINGNRFQCRTQYVSRATCLQRRKLLVKLAKAGLATVHAEQCKLNRQNEVSKVSISYNMPLEMAVTYGHLDIVKLLYEIGATTNADLFDLSSHPVSVQWGHQFQHLNQQEKVKRELEINTFIQEAASTPRSLQDLCFLKISSATASCAKRKRMLSRLPLPKLMRRHMYWPEVLSEFVEHGNNCCCPRR